MSAAEYSRRAGSLRRLVGLRMANLRRQLVFVAASGLLAVLGTLHLIDESYTGGARDGDPWGIVLVGLAALVIVFSGLALLVRFVTEGRKGWGVLISGYACLLAVWVLVWGILPVIQG